MQNGHGENSQAEGGVEKSEPDGEMSAGALYFPGKAERAAGSSAGQNMTGQDGAGVWLDRAGQTRAWAGLDHICPGY